MTGESATGIPRIDEKGVARPASGPIRRQRPTATIPTVAPRAIPEWSVAAAPALRYRPAVALLHRRPGRRHRARPATPPPNGGRLLGHWRVAVACLLVAGFATAAVGVLSGGWQVRPILTGSMRPGFPIGGVVVTQRVPLSQLRTRDVVVFHPPGEPGVDYVHRVISLQRTAAGDVIRTQGDDNPYPDPWTVRLRGPDAYVARFTIPAVGYVAVWLHSPTGRSRVLVGAGLVLLAVLASYAWDAARRRRRASAGTTGSGPPEPTATPVAPAGEAPAAALPAAEPGTEVPVGS